MAILKLNCSGCHKNFEIDEDKIDWKVTDNWFSRIDYRVAYCPGVVGRITLIGLNNLYEKKNKIE